MKSEVTGILFIIQNLLLNEIFCASFSNRTDSLSEGIRMGNAIDRSTNYNENFDDSGKVTYKIIEMGISNWKNSTILKGPLEKNKLKTFRNEHHANIVFFRRFINKRNLLSFTDHQNSSSVQEVSVENEYNGNSNHSSSLDINLHINQEIDVAHKNIVLSITPYKTFRDNFRAEVNFNKSRSFESGTDANNSNSFDSVLQGKGATFPLNNQSSDDWYTSLAAVINIQSLLNGSPNIRDIRNITSTFQLNNTDNVMLDTLTEKFDCTIDDNPVLNISCVDIDFYSIGEYLPNDTIILDLSYGNEIKLINPLFSHLKSLKSLTLSHNHHRYITRAFLGLENLEKLDLNNNDIIVISNAFSYVPRLRSLSLSNNQIRRVRTISNAVKFLKKLENFTLDHNVHINSIEKEDLYNLNNCNVSLFSLFNTTLQYIEKGSFSYMPNLKILELSVNYLNEKALANVTCGIGENVEMLYFGQMLRIKEFPIEALNCLENAKVKKLYLWYNYFSTVPVLPYLPYLQTLALSNCSIKDVEENAFKNLPNMEVISIRGNKLASVPPAIASAKNLRELYIESQNSDIYYDTFFIYNYIFQNLTKLEKLSISRLRLEILSRYSLNGLEKLKHLFLSQSNLYNIENYAFETLTSLELLDLRGNGLKILTNFTFYGLNKLKYLYLIGNYINFFEPVYPFQFCPSLSTILLQYNRIDFLPEGIFLKNENLEMLILGRNKIVPWSKRVLHPKTRIKMLELSQNNIDFITGVMLDEFNQVTDYLDLGKNPFNCSKCGMKEFKNFCLATNLSLRLPIPQANDNDYRCMNPQILQNKNIFEIDLPEVVCVNVEAPILNMVIIILVCFFVILVVGFALICYTFKWYIRYWIFHIKTDIKRKKSSFRENSYTFDAFIIYSSCDTIWVKSHLIPALENEEPQYKLCIHQRDFQVGMQITENILEAIETSRKVILILTEGFIKSEWCMYELHLAQHKLFGDARDTLILLKLRKIDKKLYSKNLSYIEKTRRCFLWTDSLIGQKLFWDKIRKQLGKPRTLISKC